MPDSSLLTCYKVQLLYGALESGGLVNYVTKKHLSRADFTAGSYSFYKGAIDLTEPLAKDERLLYRLNASYENSDSYRDFIVNKIFYSDAIFTRYLRQVSYISGVAGVLHLQQHG